MNLDFGVLWIEDSFSPEEEENLKRQIRSAGFIARIDSVKNGTGVDELARIHALYHRYDLILLDYKLKGEDGDDVAPRVRALFPSTNILFYSGSASEDDLRAMIANKKVEGVYCSARERFIARTGALIEQTARSLDRLSGMRGLAMKVVAECDGIMKSAMLSMCMRDEACVAKNLELDADVLKFLDEQKAVYSESTKGDFGARLDTRAVDSAKLFKHFRRLIRVAVASPQSFGLTAEQVERLRELRSNSAQYDKNVLQKRNLLGHVVEIEEPQGWVLKGSSEISVSDFPEIRRTFAGHIDALREMKDLITQLDGK